MPVSLLARFEFAVVIGPAIDAADFKAFVAWLKAHPDKASFGVPSNGTIPHFTGSKLEKDLGIPMTRVPYRGSAPIINDLIGGHLPFGITTLADAMPQHRAKGVKIIAVASAERSPFAARGADPEGERHRSRRGRLVRHVASRRQPAGLRQQAQRGRERGARQARGEGEAHRDRADPGRHNADGLTKELAANTAFWQPIVKATGYKIKN